MRTARWLPRVLPILEAFDRFENSMLQYNILVVLICVFQFDYKPEVNKVAQSYCNGQSTNEGLGTKLQILSDSRRKL